MANRRNYNRRRTQKLSAGNFQRPAQNPFQIPRPIGLDGIKSDYLLNYYDVKFTISYWRAAIDRALIYSDLTYLDVIYSWCIQSSAFLESLLAKRIDPALLNQYVLMDASGRVDRTATDEIINTKYFRAIVTAIISSYFMGVEALIVDVDKDEVVNFPLRNLDILNRALREGTYQYEEVLNFDDYDNMFFFQPFTDQNHALGMMQQLSRAVIAVNESYINWQITGARFSFPLTTFGFPAGNEKMREEAANIARNFGPQYYPLLPMRQDINSGKNTYDLEINQSERQSYPDAFRTFKELNMEHKSDMMQLVLGGTLMGSTEKNTNSEKLAGIHRSMYEEKLRIDNQNLTYFLTQVLRGKLSRLLQSEALAGYKVGIDGKDTIPIDDVRVLVEAATKQGRQFSDEFWEHAGIPPTFFKKTSLRDRILGPRKSQPTQSQTDNAADNEGRTDIAD